MVSSPFRSWSAIEWWDIVRADSAASDADTALSLGRGKVTGPAGACLAVRTPPAACDGPDIDSWHLACSHCWHELFAFSVDATHRVVQDVSGDFAADVLAIFAGRPEMNAGKDAGFNELLQRRGKARVAPNPIRVRLRFEKEGGVVAEVLGEYRGSRTGGGRMARGVLRMRGVANSGVQVGSSS